MKAMNTRIAAITMGALATLSACKKTNDVIKSNDKVFNVARFKQNIIDGLGQKTIGYNFVINQNGKMADSAARGFARMSQDGAVPHSIYKKMNVASINKWMTAVGAMRLMKARGIPMSDSIYKYLPKSWVKHSSIKTVTFDQLLRHSAGLTTDSISYGSGYEGLRQCIATGVLDASKPRVYNNGNFAMFRIMLFYMDNPGAAATLEASFLATHDTLSFQTSLANVYIALMQQYVFTPAGIPNADCLPERNQPTLAYNELSPGTGGYDFGDWTLDCGGGGYQLSSYNLAKLMAYVYHTENILENGQKTILENNLYGCDPEDSPNTDHGKSYGKDGALKAGSRGLQTLIMKFPNDVELVFFINSRPAEFLFYTTIMKNAYNAAWE